MRFSEFAGMDAKMEQLMRSAKAGRIVHALLLSGPRGTGKRSMAKLFTQAVFCTSPGAEPCGVCPGCKKVRSGGHMDVHTVAPEKSSVKVEQIRELIQKLSMNSYEGGKKVAIIEQADLMTENAQNALLKTLESPTGDALFLLLTDAPGALLPTITSRCLQVRFRSLEMEECARVLAARGIDPERSVLLAALAQGSVGRALEIAADGEYLLLRQRVIQAIEGIDGPDSVTRAVLAVGNVKGRESDVLEILECWARDLMRLQNGAQPLDTGNKAQLAASKYQGSLLLQQVIRFRQQLKLNISWAQALDSMAYALAGSDG